jgi:hypothetical protein
LIEDMLLNRVPQKASRIKRRLLALALIAEREHHDEQAIVWAQQLRERLGDMGQQTAAWVESELLTLRALRRLGRNDERRTRLATLRHDWPQHFAPVSRWIEALNLEAGSGAPHSAYQR